MLYPDIMKYGLKIGSLFCFLTLACSFAEDEQESMDFSFPSEEERLLEDSICGQNFLSIEFGAAGFHTYFDSYNDLNFYEKYGSNLIPFRVKGCLTKGRWQGKMDIDVAEMIVKSGYIQVVKGGFPFSQITHGIKALSGSVRISEGWTLRIGRESDYKETRDAITLGLSDHQDYEIHISWNVPIREFFLEKPKEIKKLSFDWFYKWNLGLVYRQLKVDVGLDALVRGEKSKMLLGLVRTFEVAYGKRFSFAYAALGFTPFGAVQRPFHTDGLDHRKYGCVNDKSQDSYTHALQVNYIAHPIHKWDGKIYWGTRFLLNFSGCLDLHAAELAFPLEFSCRLDDKFPRLKRYAHVVEGRIGWSPALVLPNKKATTTDNKRDRNLWTQQAAMWREDSLQVVKHVGLESLWSCMRLSFSIKWAY